MYVYICQMNLINEGTEDIVTGFDSRHVCLWSPYFLQAKENQEGHMYMCACPHICMSENEKAARRKGHCTGFASIWRPWFQTWFRYLVSAWLWEKNQPLMLWPLYDKERRKGYLYFTVLVSILQITNTAWHQRPSQGYAMHGRLLRYLEIWRNRVGWSPKWKHQH